MASRSGAKRQWTRRQSSAATPTPPSETFAYPPTTSPAQLREIAFNIHGWGLEDRPTVNTKRKPYEVINAYKATMIKGGFEGKIKELDNLTIPNIYRDDMRYTPRELDPELHKWDLNVKQYLVVGYTFRQNDPVFTANRTFERYSDNETVGVTKPDKLQYITWDECLTPILVVTPVKVNTGTCLRLFALIMPRDGLCQPCLITQERVFYRWEFRTSSGVKAAQRNKAWNSIAGSKAAELSGPSQPEKNDVDDQALEQHRPKRAKKQVQVDRQVVKEELTEPEMISIPEQNHEVEQIDQAAEQDEHLWQTFLTFDLKLLLRPSDQVADTLFVSDSDKPEWRITTRLRLDLTPEVHSIMEAIRTAISTRILAEIEQAINQVNAANTLPPAHCKGLCSFVMPESTFGQAEANLMVSDISSLWPKCSNILSANALLQIKQFLNENRFIMSVSYLRCFLFCAARTFKDLSDLSDDSIREVFQEASEMYEITSGTRDAPGDFLTGREPSVDAVLLVTLLKELCIISSWQSKMETSLSSPPLDAQIPLCYIGQEMQFSFGIDLNSARTAFSDTLRWLIMTARAEKLTSDDVMRWIRTLRNLIRES